MSFTEGEIVNGKVTGITKFGAFVTLEGGKSGLVHISEIADTYVNDIRQYLTEGQEVKVKVLPSDKEGRINLSIKKAMAAERPARPQERSASARPQQRSSTRPAPVESFHRPSAAASTGDSFEDKLRAFMKDSESKMSDMKNPPEKRAACRAGCAQNSNRSLSIQAFPGRGYSPPLFAFRAAAETT